MEEIRITRKHFSSLGMFFFWGTIIITVLRQVPSVLLFFLAPDLLSDPNISLIASGVTLYFVGIPILVALVKIVPARPVEKHHMKGGSFAIAALIAYAIVFCSNFAGLIVTTVIGLLKGSEVGNAALNMMSSVNIFLLFILAVIVAPFIEEYVFRKLIVERTVRYGQGVAILLSGLMFGLFHGNLNQFVYAFTLGMFFAFLYVKTGKLKVTIALHMMINFLGSVLPMLAYELVDLDGYFEIIRNGFNTFAIFDFIMENPLGWLIFEAYAFCILGVVLAGFVLLIVALATRKFQLAPGEVVIPRGKRFSTVMLNPGMLLYCTIWIIMIVIQLFM